MKSLSIVLSLTSLLFFVVSNMFVFFVVALTATVVNGNCLENIGDVVECSRT